MNDKKTCYDCRHSSICRLRYAMTTVMTDHIGMVNTDSAEEPKAVYVFASIAECCKRYETEEPDEVDS